MNIPKNCKECPYTKTCPAFHYGADRCKHKGAINRKTINETLKGGKQ